VLDIGTQGMQITNQAVIYALRPEARSRINSVYMFCYFVGGAVGSVAAGIVYSADKWTGVCLLGGGFGLATLAMTLFDRIRPPGRARDRAPTGVVEAER
jgi:predicted MFS family arabinose efflux permease